MIFKAKDAGVNRKRKPLTLYYCRSLYGETNNQQGYKTSIQHEIVRNMKLLLKKKDYNSLR